MDGKLTHSRLTELLIYNAELGIFNWRIKRVGIRMGDIAGRVSPDGYVRLMIDGNQHQAHRLAWFYTHGTMPIDKIDHINRDRSDNRLENLREVDHTINCRNSSVYRNNTSGVVGVSRTEACTNRPFQASVYVFGRPFRRNFKSLENAVIWRELHLKGLGNYTREHCITDDENGQMVLRIRNDVEADPIGMYEKLLTNEKAK